MPRSGVPCPYCRRPLRIKNRSLIGRTIGCPACRKRVRVVPDAGGGIRLERGRSKRRRESGAGIIELVESPSCRQRLLAVWKSPVGIAWTVAGAVAILFLLAAWPFGDAASQRKSQESADQQLQAEAEKGSDNQQEQTGRDADESQPPPEEAQTVDADEARPPVVAVRPVVPVIAARPVLPEPGPVEATIPPEVLDVAGALRQPILSFEQAEAAPLGELVALLEEMAGVPIEFAERELRADAELLDTPITLRQENTTVGAILRGVLEPVRLDYEIGFNEIRIVAADE